MTDDDKVFWLKAIFAVIAALVCSSTVALIGKIGIFAAFLIYLATYPVAVFVLKIQPPKAAGPWKVIQKMILSGLITYLFIFTVVWGTIYSLTL